MFDNLPCLEQVVWFHKPSDSGMSSLSKVRDLRVWHYGPRSKSFANLEVPQSIGRLDFYWANTRSLDGLPQLASLRRLEMHRCRDLQDLSQLPSLFPNLEHLDISACGKLKPHHCAQVVAQLPNLTVAVLQHRALPLTQAGSRVA
jgi:hypothetical protein